MNRVYKYMLSAAVVAMAAYSTGCSSSDTEGVEAGFGVAISVSLNTDSGDSIIMRSESSDESSDESESSDEAFDYSLAMSNSVIKIYDSEDRLLRRYEPISEMPDYVYLTEGEYYATVVAGESLNPVDGQENITFEGTSSFSVTSSATTSLSIKCKMINNVMTVKFDSSLDDNLEEGYSLIVAQASEIDDTVLADGYPYKKVFTESGVTYFIQPDGVTDLAWKFDGVLKSSDGFEVTKSGVIENVAAGVANYLTFSYEKEIVVSSAKVVVDTSTEDKNDIFEFSPQPTILGSDFDIATTQIASGGAFNINIDAIYQLNNISVSYDGGVIAPLVDGDVAEVEGLSYAVTTDKSGVLTISNDYFSKIGAGGDQTIEITAVDIKASSTTKDFIVTTTGVTSLSGVDFWSNSATLNATIVDATISAANTTIEYRAKGSETWSSYSLTSTGGYSYAAQSVARWSAAQTNSAGLTYYTPEEGFYPNTEYECRLVVDGVARPTVSFTTSNGAQTIPYASLSDTSLSCYTESNSTSTLYWGSGNNSNTSSLCYYATIGGVTCAKLLTTELLGVIAAGNLFYGQFTFNGLFDSPSMTGFVRFGQAYSWTARPQSLKVKYAASLGSGSISAPDGTTYSQDRARIFAAIVDWGDRHVTSAGASGDADGTWDPTSQTSTDEGQVIGYASIFIDESTSTSSLTQLEIPFHYYDTETKPSNNITLVISAAASAYGDYKTGVKGSTLYLSDFEFGY